MLERFYPGVSWATHDESDLGNSLLRRGWVRIYTDGYFEVGAFSGPAKSLVLELVAQMPPEQHVLLDEASKRSSIGSEERLTAAKFLDKFQ